VVIVAHAASLALSGKPEVLKILVTASDGRRIDRWAEAKNLTQAEAEAEISKADKGRDDYLRSFYQVRQELPTHYDLVVNTDALSIEQGVEIVLAAAG
jgi:cytidylate kinase